MSVGGGSTADVCLCLYATHRFVDMLQVLWKHSGPGHDGGSDQGLYRCVARNSVGALISRSARLRVASKCLLIVTYFAFCLGGRTCNRAAADEISVRSAKVSTHTDQRSKNWNAVIHVTTVSWREYSGRYHCYTYTAGVACKPGNSLRATFRNTRVVCLMCNRETGHCTLSS